MNTDSRTNVSAERLEGMGAGILRHMSHAMLALALHPASNLALGLVMNRIDNLPPEIELAQLLQRCAAQNTWRSARSTTRPRRSCSRACCACCGGAR